MISVSAATLYSKMAYRLRFGHIRHLPTQRLRTFLRAKRLLPHLSFVMSGLPNGVPEPQAPEIPPDYGFVAGCRAIPNGHHCDTPHNATVAPDRPEVTGGLPRQWRNLFHTITRPILRAYPPGSKNSRPSLASRSVAGGGSVYGEVASSVPIIAGVISTEKTTVA
jgi:hypothetical protein